MREGEEGLRYVCQAPCLHGGERPAGAGALPRPPALSELPGYEQEREKVIANTRALLAGRPANNVLLYGDAGTGKSSTVKAIANEFAADGLRLVEVKKNQLYQIPDLMDNWRPTP